MARDQSLVRKACGCIAAVLLAGWIGTTNQQAGADTSVATAFVSAQDQTPPDHAAAARRGARIAMPLRDDERQRAIGDVLWYTADRIAYQDKQGQHQSLAWTDLAPDRLGSFVARLPDPKDAPALILAAEVVASHTKDEDALERLLTYAIRADASLKDRADELRERIKSDEPQEDPETDTPATPDENNPKPPTDDLEGAWPKLSAEQHAQAVKDITAFTDESLDKAGLKLSRSETDRFIVYSDLGKNETARWTKLANKLYDQLCEQFGLDESSNVWRGKCLLMLFKDIKHYHHYNQTAYGKSSPGSLAYYWFQPNGEVHLLVSRQKTEEETAFLLAHELAHGFLVRYQTNKRVASWINEGFAEFMAETLVGAGIANIKAKQSRAKVKKAGRLNDFLTARNISFDHYGIAYEITAMMIKQNRAGYIAMIQGIKAGLTVEQAFEQKYGTSVEKLIAFYAKQALKMDNLRLD